ncbi:META domain-containing protein [Streptomyces ziwulingensis]|uniref:META domain-containing protein n=2 Tax=Streptomyces ziwulingensis TaxID=1045501 RepID=A0ABP9C137_9ACTN
MTVAAIALVPFAAACGNEKADGGSGSADGGGRPVTGVHWNVDSVTVDGRTHRAYGAAHLTIGADGRAKGSYGCNDFSAEAAVDGDRLRLTDATATGRACEGTPMAVERALSRALAAGPLTTEADGGRLTLTTSAGDTVRLSERRDTALYATGWKVTAPDAEGRAHLAFDRDRGTVSGSLGCNRVNAEATVRDGHITLGAPVTTRMVCEGSLMDTEKRLLELFDNQVDYRIDQQTLTLTSANGTSVRAVAVR